MTINPDRCRSLTRRHPDEPPELNGSHTVPSRYNILKRMVKRHEHVEDAYIIVINLVSLGPRPYAWEIWHRAETRSIHVAYARYGTVQQALADAKAERARRWGGHRRHRGECASTRTHAQGRLRARRREIPVVHGDQSRRSSQSSGTRAGCRARSAPRLCAPSAPCSGPGLQTPLSVSRTVCGQSVITCDAARSRFSWFGTRSMRRLRPPRISVVIGSTVV